MTYGYVRVSSITQNISRQLEEMYKCGLDHKHIFIDKQSGKDFQRKNYQRMIKKIHKGDLIVIKSIDRLGRDYSMIQEEWRRITKDIEADILVLDMPLLDTREKSNNLVGKFISDIVLQVLSFVAQNERENIKMRQAEGIKIAKEKGVKFGRPKYEITSVFKDIASKYRNHEITNLQAIDMLNVSRSTFFKYLKEIN